MPTPDPHFGFEVSCLQGVAVELRHALPAGWTLSEEDDTFVVRGEQREGWLDEVWRVARFVAYLHFTCLTRAPDAGPGARLELLSASGAGLAFRVRFLLAPASP